ncbi:hypothetical protein VTN77DRAFT_7194 [Rasamsonia byssochlamydoides]|uniref:uncharacterized protein n=1 Tax=Rasamsonia byssochlamydoides TaxID=89139 RepID=UPI0037420E47
MPTQSKEDQDQDLRVAGYDYNYPPRLTLLEKLTLFRKIFITLGSIIYQCIAGIFRGVSGAKSYRVHVGHAVIREFSRRTSWKEAQYLGAPTAKAYEQVAQKRGFEPEIVTLDHGAKGFWVGRKDARNVVVYYHGGGFQLPADKLHFNFYARIVDEFNKAQQTQQGPNDGKDRLAFFFLGYTLTPHASYPTQLRQSVEALRHILTTQPDRSPSSIFLGGDSAGGNLALAVLLHLSHPHPEIEPLPLPQQQPLAGVFTLGAWVTFRTDFPSEAMNRYKDLTGKPQGERWAAAYLGGKPGDAWNQPLLAPVEWWDGARTKVKDVLFLVGGDEVLLSAVEAFYEKFKSAVPNSTLVKGIHEGHVAPIFNPVIGIKTETQQGRALKEWLAARLL